MLVLILINVQYLQKVVFSFEKGLNAQNHSSGSHHLIKKSDRHPRPPAKLSIPLPSPLNVIWKTLQGLCGLLNASRYWGLTYDMDFC